MRRRTGLAGLTSVAGAALAMAIAAGCGGGGGGTPGPSTVTVVHGGASVPGETLALVLDDSAGRLVSSTAVTGSGTDTILVPHDGSVIFAAAVNSTLLGWSMVAQPPGGSTVHFQDPLFFAAPTPTPGGFQTWNVSWTPVASASSYLLYGPCGNTSTVNTAATISSSSCPDRTTARLLVVARDSSSRPLAWHETDTVPALPNVVTNVNFPIDQTAVANALSYISGVDPVTMIQGGAQYYLEDDELGQPTILSVAGGPPFGSLFGAFGVAPQIGAVRSLQYALYNDGTGFVRVRHTAEVPASLAFDTSTLERATLPGYDAPTGRYVFHTPADFGDGVAFFSQFAQGNSRIIFNAILPPGVQGLPLPGLPPEFLPASPLSGFTVVTALSVDDLDALNGYGDFVAAASSGLPFQFGDDGIYLIAGLD